MYQVVKGAESIGTRIALLISLLGVSKKDFAKGLGWSQPYLSRIINNVQNVGLTPVYQIIDKYKRVDARWLITGEGFPFGSPENALLEKMKYLFRISEYSEVMNREEKIVFLECLRRDANLFPDSSIAIWEKRKKRKETASHVKIQEEAIKKLEKTASNSK